MPANKLIAIIAEGFAMEAKSSPSEEAYTFWYTREAMPANKPDRIPRNNDLLNIVVNFIF